MGEKDKVWILNRYPELIRAKRQEDGLQTAEEKHCGEKQRCSPTAARI